MTHKTDTRILISALRILARDIQSGDGVANACIYEAADRIDQLDQYLTKTLSDCHRLYTALEDVLNDLKLRASLKEDDRNVLDISDGVLIRARKALAAAGK